MKKIILLSVLTIGIISCSKDNNSTTENTNPTTSGIKILKQISKDYSGGIQQSEKITTFTYENNLLSKIITNTAGINEIYNAEFTYLNGKLKQKYSFEYSSTSGITYPSTVMYNYTGDLITSQTSNENGTNYSEIYTYNSSNQLINRKEFKANGNLNDETNYEYFTDGNLSKKITLTTTPNYISLYNSYDNKKNPYELIFTSAYLKIKAITKNNVTSFNSKTYEYEYNSNNYPTKSTEKVGTEIKNITTIEYN
jgi:hypothetical protein